MLQCWEATPGKRPSFRSLYTQTSSIIEKIAGYLEMEFNPFTVQESTELEVEEPNTERHYSDAERIDPRDANI